MSVMSSLKAYYDQFRSQYIATPKIAHTENAYRSYVDVLMVAYGAMM
jgi:hypothetical protein